MPDDPVELTKEGFEILCLWSRNIAMLPLEDWDAAFERAESVGPIFDPTLFIKYMHSEKAVFIRKLIRAAIPLKQLILEAQPLVLREIEEQHR